MDTDPGGETAEGTTAGGRERLRAAVHDSPAVEVSTARGNRPRTFPLTPFYDDEAGTVVVSSPPAFAGKVEAVRENPRVSMLFYGAEEPFVLRGRAAVTDDDLEANAEYVRRLAEREPASEKRAGFSKTASLLESRVGRFLFGWYALRIVLRVTPVAIEPVDGRCGTLPPWPERDVDAATAARYDRLVLAVVDGDGWPVIRPVDGVEVDGDEAHLDVDLPVRLEAGQPACLLCHWHGPGLDRLGQRLLRGRCRPTDEGASFRPASSFSMRNETLLDRLRFVVEGKRRTRAYFRD